MKKFEACRLQCTKKGSGYKNLPGIRTNCWRMMVVESCKSEPKTGLVIKAKFSDVGEKTPSLCFKIK